jgi:hypothetical protein
MRLSAALLELLALLALARPAAAADAGAPPPQPECPSERCCAALAKFYDATGGPQSWINATGWRGGLTSGCSDVCAWTGVTCDPGGGDVGGDVIRRLNLESNNLVGSTEDGRLADGLATLTACGLSSLRLGGNALRGGLPPALLVGLRGLQNLTLYGNALHGRLPAEGLAALGGPGGLRILNLGDCGGLEGSLPPELGALVDLVTLDLSFNRASPLTHAEGGGDAAASLPQPRRLLSLGLVLVGCPPRKRRQPAGVAAPLEAEIAACPSRLPTPMPTPLPAAANPPAQNSPAACRPSCFAWPT